MLMNLLDKLLGRKPKVVEIPKPKVKVKKKLNVGKAWGTIITKQGEIIKTKICYGSRIAIPLYIKAEHSLAVGMLPYGETVYDHRLHTGKEAFIQWVHSNTVAAQANYFWQVTEDRMIRVEDIREIINITESEHEIEFEVEE